MFVMFMNLIFFHFSALGFGVSALVSDTVHDLFRVNDSWRWAFRVCIVYLNRSYMLY